MKYENIEKAVAIQNKMQEISDLLKKDDISLRSFGLKLIDKKSPIYAIAVYKYDEYITDLKRLLIAERDRLAEELEGL